MELYDRMNPEDQVQESYTRYLTFLTEKQLFGLPITEIVQIVQMQEIIGLPEQQSYAKGIINLRGQIIPVIDIRLRFGRQETEFTERTCIIITRVQDSDFGLIVDEVDEVADIQAEQISDPPRISAGSDKINNYLTGIAKLKDNSGKGERVVLLLHAGKILGQAELESLSQAAETFA